MRSLFGVLVTRRRTHQKQSLALLTSRLQSRHPPLICPLNIDFVQRFLEAVLVELLQVHGVGVLLNIKLDFLFDPL